VIPSKKVVVVRLGHHRSSKKVNDAPAEISGLIEWGLRL